MPRNDVGFRLKDREGFDTGKPAAVCIYKVGKCDDSH